MKNCLIRKPDNRICYTLAFLILLAVEFFIALFVHDNFIRPYFGDVLVVIVIYCAVRIVCLNKPVFLSVYVFIFAVAVEFSQYFEIIKLLHLENNRIARVVIGTSFSWLDILCYAVGSVAPFVWDWLRRHKHNTVKTM